MTKRFKLAVEGVIKDGSVSPEEKKLLKKIAEEDNISEVDAEVYIIQELKKQKIKIEDKKNKGESWFSRNSDLIIDTVKNIGGPLLINYVNSKMNGSTLKKKNKK